MSLGKFHRWQYASVRILRGLNGSPEGMRTSTLKDFVRKEKCIWVDLADLKGYEFIKALESLEAKGMVRASYPGNATEWMHITEKGKEVLNSSERDLQNILKGFNPKE